MHQASLFEPENVARAEVRDAIERLDLETANRKLQEFQRLWPTAELTWEPELIRIGSEMAGRPLGLDAGYRAWRKLETRLGALEVPRPRAVRIRRNFFSRLLAANRAFFEETRSWPGRSAGDFYLLAEQPRNARRLYEREIRELGDGWERRLRLANCDFRLGHPAAARSNYHWSFLLGLPEDQWDSIEDSAFLARLREEEDPEWAFPSLCADGEIGVRFSARHDFEHFKSRFDTAATRASASRRFCLSWVISENKPFCTESELVQARLQMKSLNSRLHGCYMRRLE